MMGFDPDAQMPYGEGLARAGDVLFLGIKDFKSGLYAEALPALEACANRGSIDAARLLVRIYYAGHDGLDNRDRYCYWLAVCAQLGDAASRFKLKKMIRVSGVPQCLVENQWVVSTFARKPKEKA